MEIWVMKTFIVYNLDTRLPVAVGEAIKAEWARFETADKTKICAENLIAEEISFIKKCWNFWKIKQLPAQKCADASGRERFALWISTGKFERTIAFSEAESKAVIERR